MKKRSILEDDWKVLKAGVDTFAFHDATSKLFLDTFNFLLKDAVSDEVTPAIVVPEAETVQIASVQVL